MSNEETRNEESVSENEASVHDLLPAYALGALEPDEALQVEAALASSPSAREEYRQLLETLDAVNASVDQVDPPASLGERIATSAATQRSPEPVPLRRPGWWRAFPAVAAVLLLVLVGALAFAIAELRERDGELTDLRASVNRSGTDFTQPLVWSEIVAEESSADVTGYFCRTQDGRVGWIIIEGMPTGDGSVLQLWLVDDDTVVSGGVFATDHAGRGFGVVRIDVPVQTYHQIWITIEPPGGSPRPSSEPDVKAPII